MMNSKEILSLSVRGIADAVQKRELGALRRAVEVLKKL